MSCHTKTDAATHAHKAGGDARLHRLPRRRRQRDGAQPGWPPAIRNTRRSRQGACAAALSRRPGTGRRAPSPRKATRCSTSEAPEFIRFVNPSDYRVAREACGACHLPDHPGGRAQPDGDGAHVLGRRPTTTASCRSSTTIYSARPIRATASRRTCCRPVKPTRHQMTPTKHGASARARSAAVLGGDAAGRHLPRVRARRPQHQHRNFPRSACPIRTATSQRLEEPGRPDIRQSNRGPGTGLRVSIPVLNITKTRLNDPFIWFMGTNDNPGDYRNSGCAAAMSSMPTIAIRAKAGPYAQFGNGGTSADVDPTIPKDESGHPLRHVMTRAIPTAQCMICHMHQPNLFMNTYLGYTMWDYETAAPEMWPKEQKYPTAEEMRKVLDRNPEAPAPRGNWADPNFLRHVSDLNPKIKDTQFADYHGHGWNFRAIFKRDRKGNLLDKDATSSARRPGEMASQERRQVRAHRPAVRKAVHLIDIHVDIGMQCVDCHFAQDATAAATSMARCNAVEITCQDCHGTVDAYPTLKTTGPAAPPGGTDLALLRIPDGSGRFEWVAETAAACSISARRSIPASNGSDAGQGHGRPGQPRIQPARGARQADVAHDGRRNSCNGARACDAQNLAHKDDEMACFTCHMSWTTSCAGCHLPIEANWKTASHHYEGEHDAQLRDLQSAGRARRHVPARHPRTVKGNVIAPIASRSALVLVRPTSTASTSTCSSRRCRPRAFPARPSRRITRTPSARPRPRPAPTAMSPQPTTTTRSWRSCCCSAPISSISSATTPGSARRDIEAVRVTEWNEPQAVFGSYLQKYAYPDYYKAHVERNHRELIDGAAATCSARATPMSKTSSM